MSAGAERYDNSGLPMTTARRLTASELIDEFGRASYEIGCSDMQIPRDPSGKYKAQAEREAREALSGHIAALEAELAERERQVEALQRYGIPEVLACLKERSNWLEREIRNGGNFEYLNLKREECIYIHSCIERTSFAALARTEAQP